MIGIGLNVALGAALLTRIAATGTPATDLASAGLPTCRATQVAAQLVERVLRGLVAFESLGLKPFLEEWREADALRGKAVNVSAATARRAGSRAASTCTARCWWRPRRASSASSRGM